jgi:hypothetical protein
MKAAKKLDKLVDKIFSYHPPKPPKKPKKKAAKKKKRGESSI